ncbi:hypothetical protein ACFX2J_031805 [Malus domestica]
MTQCLYNGDGHDIGRCFIVDEDFGNWIPLNVSYNIQRLHMMEVGRRRTGKQLSKSCFEFVFLCGQLNFFNGHEIDLCGFFGNYVAIQEIWLGNSWLELG